MFHILIESGKHSGLDNNDCQIAPGKSELDPSKFFSFSVVQSGKKHKALKGKFWPILMINVFTHYINTNIRFVFGSKQ